MACFITLSISWERLLCSDFKLHLELCLLSALMAGIADQRGRIGQAEMLKALVIAPNEKTNEIGSILAVARAEARKREQSRENPPIRALKYFPELCIYVAIYEAAENTNKAR